MTNADWSRLRSHAAFMFDPHHHVPSTPPRSLNKNYPVFQILEAALPLGTPAGRRSSSP
jgi:hypothetical protein